LDQTRASKPITGPDDIVVRHDWQAKGKYVAERLGTPSGRLTSILKVCRDYPPAHIDAALSFAVDATVADKTGLFFKKLDLLRAYN
jgi:hypothetical protein